MLGAIIGDTVGSVYEFNNTRNYSFKLFSERSCFTDDSIMTLAVARWLLHDKEHSYQGLEDNMVELGKRYPSPVGGYGGGFKTWLFRPKDLYEYDRRYGEMPYVSKTGRHPYNSFGNGSAMRVSPVGWFFDNLEETERVAAISAEITHNHPEGIKGAQATAAAVFLARCGRTKEEIRDYIEKTYGYDLHKSYSYWYSHYRWESSCQGTVPQAIIAFLNSTGFEDSIRKAVSLGGDSDTLACITGGISEAYYKRIPRAMADGAIGPLPEALRRVLLEMRMQTPYGKTCIIEG
jgi:ADP-ribosylglycohydrolase